MYQMSRGQSWRLQLSNYFWWWVFLTALFLAPNLLAVPNLVLSSRFSWLDALATCALAFNVVAFVVALAGSALFALLEAVTERGTSQALRAIPRFVIFTVFLAVWLQLLRGMLRVYQIEVVPVERPWELWSAVLLAAALVALLRNRFSQWVESTGQRIRIASIVLVLLTLPLSLYLGLERLNRGAEAPVTLAEPGRKLPNVVIIVLDGLTSRDMSLYGYHLPTTPNLDRLTKTWTVFERAHSSATATWAVQPAILTGRYPYTDEWHRYGDLARAGQGVLNLAQILHSFGYETIYGMGGGWWPSFYHLHHAFDRILGGGFPATNRPGNPIHTFPGHDLVNLTVWNPAVAEMFLLPHYGGISGSATTVSEPMYAVAAQLFQEQARADTAAPFFVYLHFNRPHRPWIGNEFLGRFLPIEEGLANVGSMRRYTFQKYSPDQQPIIDRLRLRYDETILKADQQLGELIDTLRRLDLYDQSLIIVTADHGENFANGYHDHLTPLLAAAEHQIPLLVKFPGQTEGRRVSATVSNVDILPTVLDVVGAAYPQEWVDGQSLLRVEHDPDRIVYISRMQVEATVDRSTVAAVSGDLKLVRRQGKELLFNLADDPDEQVNLLGQVPADGLQRALGAFVRRGRFIQAGGEITQAPALIERTTEPQTANPARSKRATTEGSYRTTVGLNVRAYPSLDYLRLSFKGAFCS